jgi:hypothetical protein
MGQKLKRHELNYSSYYGGTIATLGEGRVCEPMVIRSHTFNTLISNPNSAFLLTRGIT